MKKLKKHLTNITLLSFALLSLFITGCASTTKSQYDQYKNLVAKKDYTAAITTLESLIEKRPNNNQNFIRLHALNYAMGHYGEYNLERFTYWINRLGDEIGDTNIEYMVKEVKSARTYYDHNANDASHFYTSSLSMCEKNKKLPATLKEDEDNAPLYLRAVGDCALRKLSTEKGLRLHQVYLENISQRKNSASKALGINLYLDPDTKVDNLNKEQSIALCEILSQIASLTIEDKKLSMPTLSPEVGKNMSIIFSLSESYNDKDWQKVMDIYQDSINNPELSTTVKDTFSQVVLTKSYLMNRKNEMTVAMENLINASTHKNIQFLKHMYLMGLSEAGESKRALELYPTYLGMSITFQPQLN